MSAAKFDFYEVVTVCSQNSELTEINGMSGVVLGMEQEDDGSWHYAVDIPELEDGWSIGESDLIPTGKRMKREDLYSDALIRVEVARDTGVGRPKSYDKAR
ncbi:MAG: Imm31 family immunity protein [Alphaproteobacteria bacterium]